MKVDDRPSQAVMKFLSCHEMGGCVTIRVKGKRKTVPRDKRVMEGDLSFGTWRKTGI